jgi:hypothetical protein
MKLFRWSDKESESAGWGRKKNLGKDLVAPLLTRPPAPVRYGSHNALYGSQRRTGQGAHPGTEILKVEPSGTDTTGTTGGPRVTVKED